MQGEALLRTYLARQRIHLRRHAVKPFGMSSRRYRHHQRRRCAAVGERGDEQTFDAAGITQVVGVDQQAAIQIEELEKTSMQRAEPVQRIARETDFQDVFLAAGQYVDECASTTGEAWINHGLVHEKTFHG